MNTFYLRIVLLLLSFSNIANAFAQASGITSGAVYTLKSEGNNKLLEVKNSSMDNGANVDYWTDTKSDAQRWKVTAVGKNVYTLTNVASEKLLHIAGTPTDTLKADQYDNTNNNDVRWNIRKAGNGYYLNPAANSKFSVKSPAGDIADGTNVSLSRFSAKDSQKWLFQKETQQQDAVPTAASADKVFDAWYTQYQVETSKGFWDRAEMMEILLDAYEVTKDVKYINRFKTMYDNFITDNKTDWMYNKYNDDITWAVLFCVRGYRLTGNKTYLEKGKEQFDKMYARAATDTYGGGLNWYETKTSKNACINGPAMVACCYLAQATGDNTYYDKAIALYTWSKTYLLNTATGKVNDNVDTDKKTGTLKISTWSSSYNQGTYLGAAVMLYNYTKKDSYLADAEKIAQYTRDSMYNSKVMNNEDGGNDLPGFKGIFARYARTYTMEGNRKDLVKWLQLNAKVAYNNRNSNNITSTKWGTKTSEVNPKSSFGASTAVSLLMNTFPLK
ncbi:glycoside hydrolase family 76 protein [uncultured Mucilaginibacter sp.]|uniref:glycoside hydrolase family 76 protein n=1 Tax=uncultured Mucilaginibacter sp. TaxID=797541 RepID=UPI0026291484|nr:glycoside hydrolase family 76 protein [uncultured Mucilaginibacter sp.]